MKSQVSPAKILLHNYNVVFSSHQQVESANVKRKKVIHFYFNTHVYGICSVLVRLDIELVEGFVLSCTSDHYVMCRDCICIIGVISCVHFIIW